MTQENKNTKKWSKVALGLFIATNMAGNVPESQALETFSCDKVNDNIQFDVLVNYANIIKNYGTQDKILIADYVSQYNYNWNYQVPKYTYTPPAYYSHYTPAYYNSYYAATYYNPSYVPKYSVPASYNNYNSSQSQKAPTTAIEYLNIAKSLYEKKEYALAIENINKARQLEPDNELSYAVALGKIYEAQGKYDLASENYKKVIEIDPSNGSYYAKLGKIYKDQNKYDLAIENYKKAIELNPNDVIYQQNLNDIMLLKTTKKMN